MADRRDVPGIAERVEERDVGRVDLPARPLSVRQNAVPGGGEGTDEAADRLLLGTVRVGRRRPVADVRAALVVGESQAADRAGHLGDQ